MQLVSPRDAELKMVEHPEALVGVMNRRGHLLATRGGFRFAQWPGRSPCLGTGSDNLAVGVRGRGDGQLGQAEDELSAVT